jgi:hypothetical protein
MKPSAPCGYPLLATSHAFVHGFVGQPVSIPVTFAESVTDREPFQLSDQFLGAAVEILERRVFHFVDAFDLADQQLGIADQLEGLGAMPKGVFKGRDQTLIFGEIVGLVAEVLAEMCDLVSGLILDDDAVTGGAGIATGAAVAVGDEVMFRRILAVFEEVLGSRAGRMHSSSVQRGYKKETRIRVWL